MACNRNDNFGIVVSFLRIFLYHFMKCQHLRCWTLRETASSVVAVVVVVAAAAAAAAAAVPVPVPVPVAVGSLRSYYGDAEDNVD